MSCSRIAVIMFSIGSTVLVSMGSASAQTVYEDCFYRVIFTAGSSGSCPSGEGPYAATSALTYSCHDLGIRQTDDGCRIQLEDAPGYSGHTNPSECAPAFTKKGPLVLSACGADAGLPKGPKSLPNTCDARADGSGLAGDPVNFKTGELSLGAVDVDLGGVLRFSRHYSSDAAAVAAPFEVTLPSMGQKWSHSLEWTAIRTSSGTGSIDRVVVSEPMRASVPFISGSGGQGQGNIWRTASSSAATLVADGADLTFTSATGTEVDFDHGVGSKYYLTQIREPGELPIDVTQGPGAGDTTFTRGSESIVVSAYVGGANDGRVSGVTANGETWSYSYSGAFLSTVVGPDPSTSSTTDETTWTYSYATGGSGRVELLERRTTAEPTDVTLGQWGFSSLGRVTSVDEQALAQPLTASYSELGGVLTATVRNSSGDLLAEFESIYDDDGNPAVPLNTSGVITSVTNASGPESPVPGGAGLEVPFIAQTTIAPDSPLISVRTNKRGHQTLWEDYDALGRPGRIVRGWVDGATAPGVFSADDTFAALTETTAWHPTLWAPLNRVLPSVLQPGSDRVTTYDYDDPVSGDPNVPNESPTLRLHQRIDSGFTRDETGAVVSTAYTTTFTYDAAGRLTTVDGPRDENYTVHVYNPTTGQRTATRRHINGPGSAYLETVFSNFDTHGNPQTVTDPNGRATTYTYDTLGRVGTVTPPYAGAGSSTTTLSYDIDGNLERVDFPDDSLSQPDYRLLGYDEKNRLTHVVDAVDNAIVYDRVAGRVTRVSRWVGFVDLSNRGTLRRDNDFEYDKAGRLLKALNPLFADDSVYATVVPDENGNPEDLVDENGRTDTREFDALDRITKLLQVRSGEPTYETDFGYDSNGNLVSVTDPDSKQTEYEYDDFSRLVKVTSPNSGQTLYAYDAEPGVWVTKVEDFSGGSARITKYIYDGLDRLTSIDLPTDADWTFVYDGSDAFNQKGRLTSVSDGIVTTVREYFPRGDLKIERTTIGGVTYQVEYDYDAAGRRTSISPPSGVEAVYSFSGDRPESITVSPGPAQQVVQGITFDPFGGRTAAAFPPAGSVVSTRSYNLRGQVSAVRVTSPAGTVVDRTLDYDHVVGGAEPNDPGPNLDRIVDNRDSSQSRFFFYDSLDRLSKSTNSSGSPLYTFGYDASGNRISEYSGGAFGTTTYDAGTDLVATSGFVSQWYSLITYYEHDAFGNRIYQAFSAYAGTPSNVFDEQNRLTRYEFAAYPSLFGEYTYDAFGRRVRKVTSSETTLFFYDDAGQLVEERVTSAAPEKIRNYVWAEAEPIGIVDGGTTSPEYFWAHVDYLGMPIAVTNTPGAGNAETVWRAHYAPYGDAGVFEDPDGDGQQFRLELRMPGQYNDRESTYVYNWHRYYDPALGRYISPDPIMQAGGVNAYIYALSSPTNWIDPFGLDVNYNGFVVNNPTVRAGLDRLDRELPGKNIEVTGGDRFVDADGNVRSSTTGEIVDGTEPSTPHAEENGSRAADFKVPGATDPLCQ